MNLRLKRIIAQVFDVLIYGTIATIPIFVSTMIISFIIFASKDNGNETANTIIPIFILIGIVLIPVVYVWLCSKHLKTVQTLGYRAMNLKLVHTEGGDIEKQAVKRAIVRFLLTPLAATYLFIFLHGVILYSSQGKRDMVDNMFKTMVIEV